MTVYANPGTPGAVMSYKGRYDNYIGGKYVAPSSGEYFENITPVTGQVFCEVARGNAKDVDMAVAAGWKAFESWGKTSVTERGVAEARVSPPRLGACRDRIQTTGKPDP